MLLTNHALTGTVLGLSIENEVILVPVAFASHFVMDGLPHFGNPKFGLHEWHGKPLWFLILGSIDFTVACGVVLAACLIWPHRMPHIILGAFSAMLPDLFYIPEILFGWKLDGKLRVIHSKIQWSETPPGAIVEAGWATTMIELLRHKH